MYVFEQKEVVHQTLSDTTPSPLSHTLTLADAGRGLLSSWNLGCHSATAWEVDTMFVPVWAVVSRIMIPLDGRGRVLVSVSPELVWVYSAVHCLFQERLEGEGGGGGSLPWDFCCYEVCRASCIKRPIVIVLLITIL